MKKAIALWLLAMIDALGSHASELSGFESTNFPVVELQSSFLSHRFEVYNGELYSTSDNGIFKYIESDNSWSLWCMEDTNVIDFKICGDKVVAITIHKDENGNWDSDAADLVRYNLSNGQTENIIDAGMGSSYYGKFRSGIKRIAQHPTNPNKIVIVDYRGVWMSDDFGSTWTRKATNLFIYYHLFLGWHPTIYDLLFYSTTTGTDETLVCRSEDNGDNWEYLTPDNSGDNSCNDIAFDPNDADHLLYAGQNCIFESNDCGKTWHYVLNRSYFEEPYYLGVIYNIMYDPQDPNTVFAVGRCNSDNFMRNICILKSTDRGASWTVAAEGKKDVCNHPTDFLIHESVLFNGKIYVHTTHGIYAITVSTTGIESVGADNDAAASAVYDLQGRRIDNPAPGRVYISQGKKFILRQ